MKEVLILSRQATKETMADRGSKHVERSKDGVPQWDGDAATFQEYAELAGHWQESIPYHKRYLCGPRLQAELSGTARRFVQSKRPGWISHSNGVEVLLDHLRQHLGQPHLSEMAEYLAKYFKNSRRRRHESMNDYITRKAELYSRACQTLNRVQKRYEPKSHGGSGRVVTSTASAQPAPPTLSGPIYPDGLQDGDEDSDEQEAATGDVENQSEGQPSSDRGWRDDPWSRYQDNTWWNSQGGWWHHGWSDHASQSWQGTTQDRTSWEQPELELLPSFVQGWLLLQDAGLEAMERNNILAAIKGNFELGRVAQELRNQWVDDDLKRRDQSGRGSAWATWDDPDEIENEDEQAPDWSFLAASGLSEEGLALMQDAESEAQSAMAAIEKGRRTLKDARTRQHYVKMSRQYYGNGRGSWSKPPGGRRDGPTSTSTSTCLRCGGGHRTDACPKKSNNSGTAAMASIQEEAPCVCFAEDQACVAAEEAWMLTTQQAMEQGKAVIDGGATRTIGSVAAVEKLMELNSSNGGDPGLQRLDPELRPVFGFGNSSSDRCLSTAWMKISAGGRDGELKIHTLDKGSGPILFSIETLRALGAIVDFSEDLIVFQKLDPKRVIQMERSCTGHQLLPLAEDWFKQSTTADTAVPSLRSYI